MQHVVERRSNASQPGQHVVSVLEAFARFTVADATNPGAFVWTDAATLVPSAPRFTGKVVILVDGVSQSQAEYTAMAFREAPDAIVVGSTTAGADCNLSGIPLPGDVQSMISGIGVFYPDRTPTQRIGFVPDLVARPTAAGTREGRDEVREAGVSHALGRDFRLPRNWPTLLRRQKGTSSETAGCGDCGCACRLGLTRFATGLPDRASMP